MLRIAADCSCVFIQMKSGLETYFVPVAACILELNMVNKDPKIKRQLLHLILMVLIVFSAQYLCVDVLKGVLIAPEYCVNCKTMPKI